MIPLGAPTVFPRLARHPLLNMGFPYLKVHRLVVQVRIQTMLNYVLLQSPALGANHVKQLLQALSDPLVVNLYTSARRAGNHLKE